MDSRCPGENTEQVLHVGVVADRLTSMAARALLR
jgi:hypothetical protein